MSCPPTPTSPTSLAPPSCMASGRPKAKRTVSINTDVRSPIITVTPATLPLTPPLTPLASPLTAIKREAQAINIPSKTSPNPIEENTVEGMTPASGPDSSTDFQSTWIGTPSNSINPKDFGGWTTGQSSLQEPLKRHLAMLHPNTPPQIRNFVAIRLLSTDRPYGHEGDWKPIGEKFGDLMNAGVGLDAAKGCVQVGEGRRKDEELEKMYDIARESFVKLELKGP